MELTVFAICLFLLTQNCIGTETGDDKTCFSLSTTFQKPKASHNAHEHYNAICAKRFPNGRVGSASVEQIAVQNVLKANYEKDKQFRILDGWLYENFQTEKYTSNIVTKYKMRLGQRSISCLMQTFINGITSILTPECKVSESETTQLAQYRDFKGQLCKYYHIDKGDVHLEPCTTQIHKNAMVFCQYDNLKLKCKIIDETRSKCIKCTSDNFIGKYCQQVRNYCHKNPCGKTGICVSHLKKYSCYCSTGYKGINCTEKTAELKDKTSFKALYLLGAFICTVPPIAAALGTLIAGIVPERTTDERQKEPKNKIEKTFKSIATNKKEKLNTPSAFFEPRGQRGKTAKPTRKWSVEAIELKNEIAKVNQEKTKMTKDSCATEKETTKANQPKAKKRLTQQSPIAKELKRALEQNNKKNNSTVNVSLMGIGYSKKNKKKPKLLKLKASSTNFGQ